MRTTICTPLIAIPLLAMKLGSVNVYCTSLFIGTKGYSNNDGEPKGLSMDSPRLLTALRIWNNVGAGPGLYALCTRQSGVPSSFAPTVLCLRQSPLHALPIPIIPAQAPCSSLELCCGFLPLLPSPLLPPLNLPPRHPIHETAPASFSYAWHPAPSQAMQPHLQGPNFSDALFAAEQP